MPPAPTLRTPQRQPHIRHVPKPQINQPLGVKHGPVPAMAATGGHGVRGLAVQVVSRGREGHGPSIPRERGENKGSPLGPDSGLRRLWRRFVRQPLNQPIPHRVALHVGGFVISPASVFDAIVAAKPDDARPFQFGAGRFGFSRTLRRLGVNNAGHGREYGMVAAGAESVK